MNKDNTYSTKEVAEILGVADRTVQRYLNSYYTLESGSYRVSSKMLEILKDEYLQSLSDTVVEEFTQEEYSKFKERLIEWSLLKEQVAYHRKSAESHNRQMEKLMDIMYGRNMLEGREKGLI